MVLLIRILTYIRGFVQISVAGRFVERFLNICINRDIYVWNIRNRGSELMHMNITVDGFKKLPSIAAKSKTRVKIISRHGLPFLLYKHKKRKAFLISALIAAVAFIYLTSFVWVIDVEGNEKVNAELIVDTLEKNGFSVGSFRYGNDLAALQNEILLENDELSWAWVNIKGTRAIVQVKEKTPIPKIVDRRIPCNVVAVSDGLITEINATYGEKMASVGDVVKKGNLLISGITNTKYGGIQYLHSSGVIKARTWHSKSGVFSLKKSEFLKTDKKISKNTINFFGFRVKLYISNDIPFDEYEADTKKRFVSLSKNMVIPISLETCTYYELQHKETKLSEEDAVAVARAALAREIEAELVEGAVVVKTSYDILSAESEQIEVKLNYECIEEIGIEVPIELQ